MADSLESLNHDDDNNNDDDDIYLVWELLVSQLELSLYPVILEVSRLAWGSCRPPTRRRTGR